MLIKRHAEVVGVFDGSVMSVSKAMGVDHRTASEYLRETGIRPMRPSGVALTKRVSPEPSDTEKAYIAGLFDGEGCVGAGYKRMARAVRPESRMRFTVSISNGNLACLEFVRERYGGHINTSVRRETGRPFYHWVCAAYRSLPLLHDILPYLIIKRDHAVAALFIADTMVWPRGPRKQLSDEAATLRRLAWVGLKQAIGRTRWNPSLPRAS